MGTGTMGPGMGAVLARAGMTARLYDTSTEQLEKAKAMYDIAWGVLEKLETPDKGGGSVAYASDVAEALDGVDAVIEAVPEKLDLKKRGLRASTSSTSGPRSSSPRTRRASRSRRSPRTSSIPSGSWARTGRTRPTSSR